MIKHVLFAAVLLKVGLASACAAHPAAVPSTIFCQAETASEKAPLTLMAASFCGDVQKAFADALGTSVDFASEDNAEWAITIGVSAYRADAQISHRPTAQTETMQFDIMDASLTPERLRPFATSLAALGIDLREVRTSDVKDNLE